MKVDKPLHFRGWGRELFLIIGLAFSDQWSAAPFCIPIGVTASHCQLGRLAA